MDRRSVQIWGVMAILAVLMSTPDVTAGIFYGCKGGCFNECILNNGKTPSEKFPCYWNCLPNCLRSSPSGVQYYCQLGCSLETCIPVTYDGAELEKCVGSCSNICKP